MEMSSKATIGLVKTTENEGTKLELRVGLEFDSTEEAHEFYRKYAAQSGFKVRMGQLYRSKLDCSVHSRKFVCSKEGIQGPSRTGCPALIRVKKNHFGKWVIKKLTTHHNHPLLESFPNPKQSLELVDKTQTGFLIPIASTSENNNQSLITGREFDCRESTEVKKQESGLWVDSETESETGGLQISKIGNELYSILLDYFQSRQAVDTGFFYALEMVIPGIFGSIFWADRRSRFSCTQFGDAIIFDTSYIRNNNNNPSSSSSSSVPFAFFIGINHNKKPVLLGSALIASESEQCFTWVFQTWITAMSGQHPISIIADQDSSIQRSISRVFPHTHHRFSPSDIKANELQHLGLVHSNNHHEFKLDYKNCVYMSRTSVEFEFAWNFLSKKYGLEENLWLKEMYKIRKSWVPLYIKGTFFAGIPMHEDEDENRKSIFRNFLNAQFPSRMFVVLYEKAVEQLRKEEMSDDFKSLPIKLRTKKRIEEQGRLLYTTTLFKVFQTELLESNSCSAIKTHGDNHATVQQYMVYRNIEEDGKNFVAINCSNRNVSCSCKMFEFEGLLCRHVLKIFEIMNISEIPSRYILHRWTKNAKVGALRNDVSMGEYGGDGKALKRWSLREQVSNYIPVGTTSYTKFKIALLILFDGRKNLFCQRQIPILDPKTG